MADCLRILSENTAPIGHGKYIESRWTDLINPAPEDARTPEEVVERMKKRLKAVGSLGCI